MAGTEYYFGLAGSATGAGTLADPYLYLYNSSGAQLGFADNGGTGANSRLTYLAASSGVYYLVAAGVGTGTGTYQLSVHQEVRGDTKTEGSLAPGGSCTGEIERSGDKDWFRISLTAGDQYYLDLKGASSGQGTLANPYLYVYNSLGALIASADNGGVGNDSRLTFTPTSSGTHYLGAAGVGTGTGTYVLSAVHDDYRGSTSTNGVLSIPTDSTRVSISGEVETTGDRDWFQVNMAVGYSFHFDLEGVDTDQGTLNDPHLYLYDSAGALLASADGGGTGNNAHLDYEPSATGTYYVGVGAHGDGGIGTYRLTGWDPPIASEDPGLSPALDATLSLLSNAGSQAALDILAAAVSALAQGDSATGTPSLTEAPSGDSTAGTATTSSATAPGGSSTTPSADTPTQDATAPSGSTGGSSAPAATAPTPAATSSPTSAPPMAADSQTLTQSLASSGSSSSALLAVPH